MRTSDDGAPPGSHWYDAEAGPLVRPYAVTGGRTKAGPSGVRFDGPKQLKAVLLERKELFIRNLVSKMLGYALGRGLTLTDQCTVDRIVEKLKQSDYNAHTLILEIVNSVPFRYKPGTNPETRVILGGTP